MKKYSVNIVFRSLMLGFFVSFFCTNYTVAQTPNGLQKLETILLALKPDLQQTNTKIQYTNATAKGDTGFTLDDLVIITQPQDGNPSGKPETISIKQVIVSEFDFSQLSLADPQKKLSPPNFAKISLQGISYSGSAQDELAKKGVKPDTYSFELEYRFDPAAKTFALNKLEVQVKDKGMLDFALALDNVVLPVDGDFSKVSGEFGIKSSKFTFDDRGFLSTYVPLGSEAVGTTPEAMFSGYALIAGAMLQGLGPESTASADALASFLTDWKAVKGPVTISISPSKTLKIKDIVESAAPDATAKNLGLAVTYAGTRPGAFQTLVKQASVTPADQNASASKAATPSAEPPKGTVANTQQQTPSGSGASAPLAEPIVIGVRGGKNSSPTSVKGDNVSDVTYEGGRFYFKGDQAHGRIWVKRFDDGQSPINYTEDSFDEWSVYLTDDDGNKTQIDLFQKLIILDENEDDALKIKSAQATH
ncbi:MAG: hypothetical protein ORN52_07615 [Beijerinckiaceae bacterium]|nr:hypothetical protein [Beijerinckiaceae bacterium]